MATTGQASAVPLRSFLPRLGHAELHGDRGEVLLLPHRRHRQRPRPRRQHRQTHPHLRLRSAGLPRTTPTESVPQPYRYVGAYADPTGLYKMGHRYYDPTLGRFTQPDPSGQEKNPYLRSQRLVG
ncbi:RHS repeat-associated core domain-containing protein [Streptomyces sp. NPDC048568]|uniref:RHS repeat-associated core domain-containing protein n=1 Tax=Streptomyces sp. NPDC048568 TaxID=3365571 RepID=UPI00371C2311